MVKIENIKKSFGKLQVLNGIDVSIEKGKAMAVLGPNGSGKTTFIKCILGLVIPDSGKIFVNGENIFNNWHYRTHIGYLPQIARFPENLSVKELLAMIQDIKKMKADVDELIALFEVKSFLAKPLRSLSGGTRQKVNAILALMFHPELYILDEPTVGLDPVSRVRFRELILKEKQNGKTIMLTTHLLNEVEEIADELIFLMDGRIYYQGSPHELKIQHNENTLEKAIAKMLC